METCDVIVIREGIRNGFLLTYHEYAKITSTL